MATRSSPAARKRSAAKAPRAPNGSARQAKKQSAHSAPRKLSRLKRPDGLALEEWQSELRRQFGREQRFASRTSAGTRCSPSSRSPTRRARTPTASPSAAARPGDNFCSCPDFATNTLGTCKHVEFTLAALERQRAAARRALAAGFQPAYSEVFLQYGAQREVRFRPGARLPRRSWPGWRRSYFDADGRLLPEAFAQVRHVPRRRRQASITSCAATTMRCGFVAEVRDAERRRERIGQAFPRGIRSAAFKDLLKSPAVRLPARRARCSPRGPAGA